MTFRAPSLRNAGLWGTASPQSCLVLSVGRICLWSHCQPTWECLQHLLPYLMWRELTMQIGLPDSVSIRWILTYTEASTSSFLFLNIGQDRYRENPSHGWRLTLSWCLPLTLPLSLLLPLRHCMQVTVLTQPVGDRQQCELSHCLRCDNEGDFFGANALWSLSGQWNQMQRMFGFEGRQWWMSGGCCLFAE